MSTFHPFRATIPPITDHEPRPLWSVMIPTYNCAAYLRETLASVLAQDLGPDIMQIEVVDDCSTKDDPAAVVEELGQGRVTFYRQPRNQGHTRNFSTCLQRSWGRLVHLLHGDDCVRDGFYATMQRPFEEHPELGAAFCRQIFMNEHGQWQSISPLLQPHSGILPNWLETIAVGQRLQTPAMVVRRDVYETLGGFDQRIRYFGEDWEMWTRIAAHYPVWHEVEPLAIYRMHTSSLTGRTLRTGENMRDLRQALTMIKDYLPHNRAEELHRQATEAGALGALRRARRMLSAGKRQGALAQTREALRWSRSPRVLERVLMLMVSGLRQRVVSGRWSVNSEQ